MAAKKTTTKAKTTKAARAPVEKPARATRRKTKPARVPAGPLVTSVEGLDGAHPGASARFLASALHEERWNHREALRQILKVFGADFCRSVFSDVTRLWKTASERDLQSMGGDPGMGQGALFLLVARQRVTAAEARKITLWRHQATQPIALHPETTPVVRPLGMALAPRTQPDAVTPA